MNLHIQYNEYETFQTASIVIWLQVDDRMLMIGSIELTSAGWELRLITELQGQVDRDLQRVIVTTAARDDAILAALCSESFVLRALADHPV